MSSNAPYDMNICSTYVSSQERCIKQMCKKRFNKRQMSACSFYSRQDCSRLCRLNETLVFVVDRFYKYSVIYSPLSSRLTVLKSYVSLSIACFVVVVVVFNIHWSRVLTALFGCYMAGATRKCCRLGVFWVHHTTMHYHTSFCAN